MRGKGRCHLGEIILAVGPQINDAAGREDLERQLAETRIDQPVLSMFALGPGIGKIDVQRLDRFSRHQILEQVGGFDAQEPQIDQAGAQAFAVDFPQPAEQPFHREEIPIGMPPGVLDGKGTVAAAQLQFQRQ